MSERDDRARRSQPKLSVVLAWRGDAAPLATCVEWLRRQTLACGAELVVAHPGEAELPADAAVGVRFVACAADASRAQLRAAGMRVASGDVVAFTDDEPALQWTMPWPVTSAGPAATTTEHER